MEKERHHPFPLLLSLPATISIRWIDCTQPGACFFTPEYANLAHSDSPAKSQSISGCLFGFWLYGDLQGHPNFSPGVHDLRCSGLDFELHQDDAFAMYCG